MATTSRVGVNGWLQADDSTAQSRVGTGGWYQVNAVGGGGNSINVPAGSLTLTSYAPTVTATDNQSVSVPAGSLALTGYAPTVTASANNAITVPAGTLALTGYAPTVATGDAQIIQPPTASLVLDAYAPTVIASEHNAILVPVGALTLTGRTPTVTNGAGGGTGATAEEIVTALMAHEIEPGVSVQFALRVILAAVSGPTAGIGSNTERYYDPDGVVARITATFDGDSNRTSVTLDGS